MTKQWTLTATVLSLVALLLFGIIPSAASQSLQGIQWTTFEEGRQRSEDENKKVFLVFNADWCRYCLKMEKETFQDPTVIAYVNRNFVPIRVNSDRQQEIAMKFGVRGLPDTRFINEKGEVITYRPGYIAADELLKVLKFISSDSYLSMSFTAFLETQK
jgi:thioredoxin-related protein